MFFTFAIINSYVIFFYIFKFLRKNQKKVVPSPPPFGLLVGIDENNNNIYIPEKSLYQNMLITGSIGTGKTASAMYPFTKQLMFFNSDNIDKKLGFLILDVKGNYYSKILEFAKECGREKDVVVIEINGKYTYNPLDKPNLKASILANRLKTILLLFSPNNSESYWIDVAEQTLESAITFCRIYNNNYVNFEEIHKLITCIDYFYSKIKDVRNIFISGILNNSAIYDLARSISFLESNYFSLDSRTFNILKSDITRITNCFISDYFVKNTFCPSKENENFFGFRDVINNGKIVVLNMNIGEFKNLSKIIATYLKLDFQTDVISQLSSPSGVIRPMVFISDEYQEYVTESDSNFYAQSRESKCINIVATQSYTSLLNSLNNSNSLKVIVQNLVNKLWFRSDDIFTIEDIQKQIGKEYKENISTTYSENSNDSSYNFLTHNFTSYDSNLSESINSSFQFDYIFDYNFFTQDLKTFESLGFLSDGQKIQKPRKLKMIPYFKSGGINEKF